ncbi:MAG: anti-sigma factor [Ancalomicrobiaceae bacterium]|nr:anti-sigma factor [Ancalomicrobiaceae bacterium]
MSTPDDLDALAGEYVLGTLDLVERRAVDARRSREPLLDAAIRGWEDRLAPLNELLPEATLEADLFPSISAAIDRLGADQGIAHLNRRIRRWQWAAGLASAAAVVLAVGLGASMLLTRTAQTELVALLAKDATSPAFVVSVDLASRQLTVLPSAVEPPAGKAYELWLVNARYEAPRSLGLISPSAATRSDRLASYSDEVIASSTLAVSLEPDGGSPTGKPTGPVVFSGRFVHPKI